jgi:hypothetical protein
MPADMSSDGSPQQLRLSIAAPRDGWSVLRVAVGGDNQEFTFSYTPEDTLERLVLAADSLLTTPVEQRITLHDGAEERDLWLTPTAQSRATFRVVRHSDHSRNEPGETVLTADVDVRVFGTAVWRSMRSIEGALGRGRVPRTMASSVPGALGGPVGRARASVPWVSERQRRGWPTSGCS